METDNFNNIGSKDRHKGLSGWVVTRIAPVVLNLKYFEYFQ